MSGGKISLSEFSILEKKLKVLCCWFRKKEEEEEGFSRRSKKMF